MTKIRTFPLAIIVVAAIFGGIGIASTAGWWNTESTKEPATIRSGEFSGLPSPADIRGSYTWNDIEKAFGVPAERMMAAFSASDPDERVSALEAIYAGKLPAGTEIGTDSVRLFVALFTGLPHEPEADTVLPAAAIPILRSEGKAETSRIDAAAAKAFDPAAGATAAPTAVVPTVSAAPAAPQAAAVPAATEHEVKSGEITGKTTFAELKAWGTDMGKVEAIVGGLGPDSQAVKDYCAAKGLSFSDLKVKLQALVP
jgi:hypothetical protein